MLSYAMYAIVAQEVGAFKFRIPPSEILLKFGIEKTKFPPKRKT